MKKSVAVILVLLLLPIAFAAKSYSREVGSGSPFYITGAQILDLPPPPAPPGGEQEQPETQPAPTTQPVPPTPEPPAPTTKAADLLAQAEQEVSSLTGRVEALEQKTSALNLLPEFEERLNTAEAQSSSASNVVARVDALQSQVESMKVDLENVKYAANRPVVEQPTFTQSIDSLRTTIKTNAVFSLGLAIFALILVIAVIVTGINQRKTAFQDNKQMIKQYLSNYQAQGYPLSTLRMHLRACGWKDEFVEDCLKELG